eukprot:scaffold376088_cov20-Attheya_sp.AAC.1
MDQSHQKGRTIKRIHRAVRTFVPMTKVLTWTPLMLDGQSLSKAQPLELRSRTFVDSFEPKNGCLFLKLSNLPEIACKM